MMRPFAISTTRAISGTMSGSSWVTRMIPIPDWASERIVSRRPCWALDVERIAGFVEEQRSRFVNQSTGDQNALGFTGGHFIDGALGEMRDSQLRESCFGHLFLFGIETVIGKDA